MEHVATKLGDLLSVKYKSNLSRDIESIQSQSQELLQHFIERK